MSDDFAFPTITDKESKETPFPYVFVLDDGTFRELLKDEIDYLKTPFHPADGGRPYVKTSYHSLTPDGKIAGFLKRKRLPRKLIGARRWWQLW